MGSTCILTDSSVQFPQLSFPGRNLIRIVPVSIRIDDRFYLEGKELKTSQFPQLAVGKSAPELIPPTVDEFINQFLDLAKNFDTIIAIPMSSNLTQVFQNAALAEEKVRGCANIILIDSQTISIGLGAIIQAAADLISRGALPVEVEKRIRSMIPHTYMTICTPGLSYLNHAGFIDQSQALVGEYLGIMPIFTLEEGILTPVEKVKNLRSLVDYYQEYICEFDRLNHIAFIQSCPPISREARIVREYAQSEFQTTVFSEHHINPTLASLIGPRSSGLVIIEEFQDY
ncbi:MAG TPA: DegV family protein [Anaerolineaceae bacterium]